MQALIRPHELLWIRRLSALHYRIKNVLLMAGWRGATLDEIVAAVDYDRDDVIVELTSKNDYVHCPGCDYWSMNRCAEPFVPPGVCHDLYTCCLSDPFASREGRIAAKKNAVFHVNNPHREEGARLRQVPLFTEPKLRVHEPASTT